ncbi:hypothetical protein CLOM_g7648 [Closterium sp. NIES-68]|nr:hypothetical protein CLOM_g7648 [Closterium sp. NIES-68]GJP65860.1 hypothetical protein CLOP_g22768 [Closterium sp. NIES-67]
MSHSCVFIPSTACNDPTALTAPLLPTASRGGDNAAAAPASTAEAGGGHHGEKRGLKRSLTVVDGVCMVLGVVVGSGIFATPGVVLVDSGGVPLSALIVWLCAGVVAYSCCEVYAELGSSIPHAGGDGEYIQLAFGDLLSFVFMWMFFFVSTGGGIAILIVTFARYTIALLPGMQGASQEQMELGVRIIGCSFTLLLTAINCAGVKAGALVQNILTVTKALLIAAVVACAPIFVALHGTSVAATNFSQPLPPISSYNWSRAGAGLVAAVWAFDGWNCLGYLSEELKNPKKDLPRSLSFGMLTAVGICLAVNSAYFCILPLAAVGKSEVVAVEAVEAVFGPPSGRFIAFLVALNVLGAANATLLCHARFFYAKARDGQLFSFLSGVTSGGAPYASLIATGGWIAVVVFVAANHLEKLIDYFGIAAWMFYGLVGASLIKLRWDLPDLPRPYKASLYPLPGIIVVVASTYLVISSLVTQLVPSLLSLAFVFAALPVYFAIRCMRSTACCAASCTKTASTVHIIPETDARKPLLS